MIDAEVHEDFADAIRDYLRDRPRTTPVSAVDLTIAILRAARDKPGTGLVGPRLGLSRAALDAAISTMERLLPAAQAPLLKDFGNFSATVRNVRASLGADVPVTAASIVGQLQLLHPEYAGGALATLTLRTAGGVLATTDEWLDRVIGLYDLNAVANSRHQVIDGQLLICGLAELDPSLRADLETSGVLAQLQSEIEVAPSTGGAEPDRGPLLGGVAADRVDPNQGIPLDRDQLGVAPYVSMLATVIADKTTPMPLSVGIFGEWGSGKSYFMGLLREQIKKKAESNEDTYYHDIVQIGFNAWHYADANLWASLGDEIFRELIGPEESITSRQKRIRDELDKEAAQRKDLEAATKHAQEETARLREQLAEASEDRDARQSDVWQALLESPRFKETLEVAWKRLGITEQVEQTKLLANELHGVATEEAMLRRAFDRRWRGVAAVAIVISVGLVVLAVARDATIAWWTGGGAATVAAFVTAAAVIAGRARSGLRLLREVTEEVKSGAALRATARQDKALAPLVADLRQAEGVQQGLETQLAKVVDRVGELGQELAELAPGRRLYAFLVERVAAGDYARSLGLISVIRKDFQRLIALMNDWRDHPEKEGAENPIERIVLYIDDLDRCSPAQVVQVLQAVHLLLALDLFVVVVGVDPRWLLRSLRRQYPTLLETEATDEAEPDGWDVSPEDYLEKIFNIPLVLSGMGKGNLEALLNGIVADQQALIDAAAQPPGAIGRTDPPDPGGDGNAGGGAEGRAGSSVGQVGVGMDADLIQPGSQAAATLTNQPEGRPRLLTTAEIDLLAALESLIHTPREAKRLLNLYRMIRSTRDLSEASRFLGDDGAPGEFQAVITLLGLLTAHARLLGQVLDTVPDVESGIRGGLVHRPSAETWHALVRDMRPVRDGDRWNNGIVGFIPAQDLAHWWLLADGLSNATAQVTLADLSTFQVWQSRIRRFSFVLSPLAAPVPSADPGDVEALPSGMTSM